MKRRSIYTFFLVVGFLVPVSVWSQDCTGGPSPEDIDLYLACWNSPLEGEGETFWEAGRANDVDPRLLVALAGAESSFGKAICTPFNAWNWSYRGVCKSPFDSWSDGIWTVAEGVRRIYLDGGKNTIHTMSDGRRPSYCGKGCGFWIPNVTRFFRDQGGDPMSDDLGFPAINDLPDVLATNMPSESASAHETLHPFEERPTYVPLPDRPSAPTGTVDLNGMVQVSWEDRSDNEVGFRVYRRSSDNPVAWEVIASLQANVNSFIDDTIACGEAYYYGVAAFNDGGESEHAGWRVVLIPACSQSR
jgi:hypothetical protein